MLLKSNAVRSIIAAGIAGVLFLTGCAQNASSSAASSQSGTTPEAASTTQKAEGIDYLVLVNEYHRLPEGWEENLDLVEVPGALYEDKNGTVKVERKAYEAYQKLHDALLEEGVKVELDSVYRSIDDQWQIIRDFTKDYGYDYTATHVGVPGYSEHHTGLALDLYLIIDGKDVYENNEMVAHPEVWEKVHAKLADYGFNLRYTKEGEAKGGIAYEPWHIRYVGEEVARELQDTGKTLEEYLGVTDATKERPFKVTYGASCRFSAPDFDSAIDAFMAEFDGWKGCTMNAVTYAGDEASDKDLDYANSLRDKSTPEFDTAIVIKSDFRTSSAEQLEGMTLEPEMNYKDYEWHLGRTGLGDWKLVGWGPAEEAASE